MSVSYLSLPDESMAMIYMPSSSFWVPYNIDLHSPLAQASYIDATIANSRDF